MDRKIKTKSLKITLIIMAVSLAPILATATEVSAQSTIPNGGNQGSPTGSTGINNAPRNVPQTQTSTITIHDKINSTFTVSKDDPNATKIITRALRDRLADLVHTVAHKNATITISDAKITNGLTNETIILSNNVTSINSSVRRLANNILGGTTSTTGSSAVQLNLITDLTCMSNSDRSSANCSIHLIIGR
jgi:hypothetical protein